MPFLSPAVYVREHDLSLYATNLSTTIVAMVGGAQRGPLNVPTLCTSSQQWVNTFGNPTPDHYGSYAALQFLAEGRSIWYERVAGESAFASLYQLPTNESTGISEITGGAPGTGYTSAPRVQIDGDGTGAVAVARVSGGSVVGVDVTNPGRGYTTATVTLVGAGTGATGWTATIGSTGDTAAAQTSSAGPFVVLSAGQILAAVKNSGGAGYLEGDAGSIGGAGTGGTYEVTTVLPTSYAITAVDSPGKKFTVAGDKSLLFPALSSLDVAGSTGNDGTYTVVSSTFAIDHTDIVVTEAVPDATADGTVTGLTGAVTAITISGPGSGYAIATGVTTTATSGNGTGLTVNVTSVTAATTSLIVTELDRSSGVLVTTDRTVAVTVGPTRSAANVVSDITGTSGYGAWKFTAAVSSTSVKLTHKTKDSLHGLRIKDTTTFVGFQDFSEKWGVDVDAFPATIFGSVTGDVPILAGINDELAVLEYDRRTGSLIVTERVFALTPGNPRTLAEIAGEVNAAALSGSFSIAADASGGNFILSSAGQENELFGLFVDDSTIIRAAAAATLGLDTTKPYYGSKAKWLFRANSPGKWGDSINVKVSPGTKTGTFSIAVSVEGSVLETYNNISIDPASTDYVETRINGVSQFIEVDDNTDIANSPTFTGAQGANLVFGADGLTDLGDAEFIGVLKGPDGTPTGLQAFINPELIDVQLVAVPGIFSAPVVDAVIDLCEIRADCLGVIDPPFGLSFSKVIDWHNGAGAYQDHAAFDSSYACLYWPWVEVFDPTNNIKVWTPPSGHVLRAMALTDRVGEPWFAPAGQLRGRIVPAQRLEHVPSLGERDALYSDGNAINPITKVSDGQGGGQICIWGQRTLQRKPSALDRVNVRRLMLVIEKTIATSARFLVFEQNDKILWDQFVDLASPYLNSIKARRGVRDFQVRCDKTTNTDDAIDRNEMHAVLLIKPEKTAEFIVLDFAVTKQGSTFNEIVTF